MDFDKIRSDFPVLQKNLIYFDNACTTLKPKSVIDAVTAYYSEYSGCAGRSVHKLSMKTEEEFEKARKNVASFVGAPPEELVWTRNATEAMNLVAKSLDFSQKNKVVISNLEHHSALLPFQLLPSQKKIFLDFVISDSEGSLSLDDFEKKIDKKTRLVVLHHTSNVLGTSPAVHEITKIAHDNGALILIDGAQGVPHHKTDFRKSNFDFLAFSGHKMLGPTGIGCLVGKRHLLEEMSPFLVGGETITDVRLRSCTFAKPPKKFEAGIQHYAGAIGLSAAAEYLKKIGMENVEKRETELSKKLLETISGISGTKIYGSSDYRKRCALVSFNFKSANPKEIAMMLDKTANIAVRSGLFCAQPAMEHLNAKKGAIRASLYFYNTLEEIETFANALKRIASLY